jgi:hypothetical protein
MNGLLSVTVSMWVIKLNHFSKPAFEEKQHGPGSGRLLNYEKEFEILLKEVAVDDTSF